MRHVFLINPAAGKRNAAPFLIAQIEQVFADCDYTIVLSRGPGDCAIQAAAAAAAAPATDESAAQTQTEKEE